MLKFLRHPRKSVLSAAIATGTALATAAVLPGAANAAASRNGPADIEIYVAPTGSGPQLGTKAHPFRSLEAARTAVRDVNLKAKTDIDVVLADGTYTLDRTFTLTDRDSGHERAHHHLPGGARGEPGHQRRSAGHRLDRLGREPQHLQGPRRCRRHPPVVRERRTRDAGARAARTRAASARRRPATPSPTPALPATATSRTSRSPAAGAGSCSAAPSSRSSAPP